MSSASSSSSGRYNRVSDMEPFLQRSKEDQEFRDSSTDGSEDLSPYRRHPNVWSCKSTLPWAVISTLLLTINLFLLIQLSTRRADCLSTSNGLTNFDGGFETDMESARPFIETKLVKFTGSVAFYENGTMYRDYPKDQPQYVGDPNAEIDAAWDDLLWGSAVDLPGHLAGKMKDMTWKELDADLYRTGLEVFHQLHCLDYIRKALYPEYYGQEDDNDRLYMMHVEHCIDYVRQALMCLADSTPVRLEWRKESHFLIPKFDQPHTCRNFDMLKGFSNSHALELYNDENQRKINEKVAQGVL
ncbi:hypothetical protein E8E14_011432 [Neopestalotiopsis sp. 37M]|nr:hypothetical protein E8E14_011432 [Neopestalotiopsis sp. 37M]